MPHPEAFHDFTNHPDWTRGKEALKREGKRIESREGDGMRIFINAVDYTRDAIKSGRLSSQI
jgi:phosphoribosylformylglycinamidine synthase